MAGQQLPAAATSDGGGKRWMSMEDFCLELGISPSTAYKWSASGPGSGRFPRFRKLPNGSIRIRRDWFDDWLSSLGPAA